MVTARGLQNKDMSTVVDIFKKASKATQKEIAKGEDMSVLSVLLGLMEVEKDMWVWLAELVDVPVDEFMVMPIGSSMDVIEQIADMPASQDFFARAAKRIGGPLKRLSTQFSIDTAGRMKKSASSPMPDSEGSDDS